MRTHGRGRAAHIPGLAAPLERRPVGALAILITLLAGTAGCRDHEEHDSARSRVPPAAETKAASAAPVNPETDRRDAAAPGGAEATHPGAMAGAVAAPIALPPAPPLPPAPEGLPAPPTVAGTPEMVALGRLLFFDERLSRGRALACASCHAPDKSWSDGRVRAETAAGRLNLRHTPVLLNLAYVRQFFWDGRAPSLGHAIEAHWTGQLAVDAEAVARSLARIPAYRAHFFRAFVQEPSGHGIVTALAAFVRTLTSGDAPWDRHERDATGSAVSADARAGFVIFTEKAQCALCHPPPLYADGRVHNAGIGGVHPDGRLLDPGRGRVTESPFELGAFRTPTLRGLMHSAPYFHDGSAADLEAAIEAHLTGSHVNGASPHLRRVQLDAGERRQLIEFLKTLSPPASLYERPALP